MDYFSPQCPKCKSSDKVVIFVKDNSFHVDTYLCKRCSKVFKANEAYPEYTASAYQVTESSISWSGSPTLLPSNC